MGTVIAPSKGGKFVRYCDFCGRNEHEVPVLVASPNGAHICGDCAAECSVVVADAIKEKSHE